LSIRQFGERHRIRLHRALGACVAAGRARVSVQIQADAIYRTPERRLSLGPFMVVAHAEATDGCLVAGPDLIAYLFVLPPVVRLIRER